MEYLIGIVLALAVAGLASDVGFARDRSFASTVLIVIASYYALFAVIGASTRTLVFESFVAGGFLLFAVVGFKKNLWLVALATMGHGVFDFLHHLFIDNPGVPSWWPGFCMAFDLLFGGWVAMLLVRRSHPSLSANSFVRKAASMSVLEFKVPPAGGSTCNSGAHVAQRFRSADFALAISDRTGGEGVRLRWRYIRLTD